MQKKLIALAIAGLVSGSALAQSNVQIYGIVDIGLESASSGFGSQFRMQSGQSWGNRIGFKGEEVLGGGNKFIWTLEEGFALDNGQFTAHSSATNGSSTNNPPINGTIANVQNTAAQTTGNFAFGRQAWAGLNGDWGTLTFGRQYEPIFLIVATTDPFLAGTTAQTSNTLQNVSGFLQRFDNFAYYQSPTMNGFKVTAGYTTGSELNLAGVTATPAAVQNFINGPSATATSLRSKKEGQGYALTAQYVNGPAYVAVGYHNYYLASNAAAILAPANEAAQAKTSIFAGMYDFGMAKLAFNWMKGEITQSGIASKLGDNSAYTLGITIPFGTAHKIMGVYGARDDKTAANKDMKHVGIGYEFAWSKRTIFYTAYAKLTNEDRFTATGAAAGAGAFLNSASSTFQAPINGNYDPSSFELGVRHHF